MKRGRRLDPLNEVRQTISSHLKIALTMKETRRKFKMRPVLHIQKLSFQLRLATETTVFNK